VFFRGAVDNAVATYLGHYPWFMTRNGLDAWLPLAADGDRVLNLARTACCGLCASVVSDVSTNAIRVVKTYRQTSDEELSFAQAFSRVLKEAGLVGLLTRGLGTKCAANAINSIVFSFVIKVFQE